jgi:serine/threonine protein kinase
VDSGNRRTSKERLAADDIVGDATEVSLMPAPPSPSGSLTRPEEVVEPPVANPDELRIGEKLGEFVIEEKVAEGGMGVVYAAVNANIGKRAAIKVLRRDLCADASQVRRFLDEARVVNKIGHPNIIDVFAYGEMADGRWYLVMPWLKGRSLRQRMDAGQPSLAELCAIVRPLCRALGAAHESHVIHRDLKPDNIFLMEVRGEAPQVKLLDFGIAKLQRRDGVVDKTATGAMVGTPQYIAPEQARGYQIDHNVDTYALGGIMFEMLTGRPPFEADNAMDVVAKHLLSPPLRPSESAANVPPELDELVHAMLDKVPARRPLLTTVHATLDAIATRLAFEHEGSSAAWAAISTSSSRATPLPSGVAPSVTPAPAEAVRRSIDPITAVPPRESEPIDVSPYTSSTGRLLRIALVAIAVVAVAVVAFVVVRQGASSSPDNASPDHTQSTPPQPPPQPAPVVAPTPQPAGTTQVTAGSGQPVTVDNGSGSAAQVGSAAHAVEVVPKPPPLPATTRTPSPNPNRVHGNPTAKLPPHHDDPKPPPPPPPPPKPPEPKPLDFSLPKDPNKLAPTNP